MPVNNAVEPVSTGRVGNSGRNLVRYVVRGVLVFSAILLCGMFSAGCGMSRETKDLTGRVFGHNGAMDEYMAVTTAVLQSHLELVKAFEAKDPTVKLKAKTADGKDVEISIVEYRKALETLLTYPDKFKAAYHAVNEAVQANNGFNGFVDQFMRTISADQFWNLVGPR